MDITYLKVAGYDVYLYRAIDKEGNLLDVTLRETRNKESAIHFSAMRQNNNPETNNNGQRARI